MYLAVCLEQQFAPNPPNVWDFEEGVADEIETFLRLPITTQPELTFVEEVAERLSALRPRKASGQEGVTTAALKMLLE